MKRYLITVNVREFGGNRIAPREYDITAKNSHDARLNALYEAHKEGLYTCGIHRTEELIYSRQ